jgi:low temperature requirement protein LtrA
LLVLLSSLLTSSLALSIWNSFLATLGGFIVAWAFCQPSTCLFASFMITYPLSFNERVTFVLVGWELGCGFMCMLPTNGLLLGQTLHTLPTCTYIGIDTLKPKGLGSW